MPGETLDARVAALWIMHGMECVKLLRAHGRSRHAANFAEALEELTDILAREVGREELSKAIDWASNVLWGEDELTGPAGLGH